MSEEIPGTMGNIDLKRFASGDADAVRQLYRQYGRAVYTVAYSALRDPGLAEEAVQLTFLQAWKAASRFDVTKDPKPWLYAIARRVAVDVYRREKRHAGSVPLEHEADIAALPESFERTWEAWEIRLALDQMPEMHREIIEATHFLGLSQEETARKLGIALGTVKSRSHRAHRTLAGLLAHLKEATA
jgi:RNA polymerase sigma-70 factor (ECF subfamily)